MKVSQVDVILTSEDIMSIIHEFVKVEGLEITELNIDKHIEVKGVFKRVVALGFKASAQIKGVENDRVTIKFSNASLMSIGILRPFRKLALKIGLKGFKDQGILVSGDEIIIDIDTILKKVPFINLKLNDAKIIDTTVKVTVNEVDFSLSKFQEPAIEVDVKEKVEGMVKDDDYIMNIEVNKIDDAYTHSRECLIEKIPDKAKPYKDYIMFIPDITALIYRLFKDKRVPLKTKIILGSALGYIALPIDIIPDKIPIIGSLDELTIFFFAFNRVINDVDIDVILENWQGKNEFVIVLKNAVEFLSGFTGAQNLDTIYEVIDTLVSN